MAGTGKSCYLSGMRYLLLLAVVLVRIPLVGPATVITPLAAAASECMNYYPEAISNPEDRQKNIGLLKPTPGYHLIKDLGLGIIRAVWSGGGRLFVLHANTLYEIGVGTYTKGASGGGSIISSNALPTLYNSGPAQIFANASGTMIAIIANGYVHYSTGGAITTATFATGGDVTALSGAILGTSLFVNRPWGGSPDLGRRVNFSAPNDFTSWDALDFKEKEGGADYVQRVVSNGGILHAMGTEQSEAWQLSPSTGLPGVIPGAEIREWMPARWAMSEMPQGLFYIGGSPRGQMVGYLMRGLVPVPISTPAIEQAWQRSGVFASGAVSFGYQNEAGHQFWVISFPGDPFCTVYDITSSEQFGYPVWHRRATWDAGSSAFINPPAWFHTYIPEWLGGTHVVASWQGGEIYEMSESYYDDDGQDIKRIRAIPIRYFEGKRGYFGRQDIQAAGSSIARDHSDDNGATWSTPEAEAGNGTTRRYWPTGGSCNSPGRIWRYTQKGQAYCALLDLQGDESPGSV